MNKSETKERTKTCVAHCRNCERHFTGDTAFDLHRLDFECWPPEARLNRSGEPYLMPWTHSGVCTFKSADGLSYGSECTIWQTTKKFGGHYGEA